MRIASLRPYAARRVSRKPSSLPMAGVLAASWRDALPPDRVERVVRFIRDVWASTPVHKYKRFHFGEKEPYLTQVLWARLSKLQREAGLTGEFSTEAHVGRMDEETGEFDLRGRADIKYFSDSPGNEICVTFEFKKLRTGPHRRSYVDEGMMRFVKGVYARDHGLGFMVGMTCAANADESVAKLGRVMQNPTRRSMLSMVQDTKGRFLRPPEPELVELVRFQTMHARTLIEAPDIFLGHIFVNLVTRTVDREAGEDLPEPD